MKRKSIALLLVNLLISTTLVVAQSNPVLSLVHDDFVKPSMDARYREMIKKLKAACEQYKTGPNWPPIVYDDNSYRHIVGIKSLADLEKNPFADLETKMGKEALAKLWAEFDECLESQRDIVMIPIPEFLSLSN